MLRVSLLLSCTVLEVAVTWQDSMFYGVIDIKDMPAPAARPIHGTELSTLELSTCNLDKHIDS